jgi:hypothetical protein
MMSWSMQRLALTVGALLLAGCGPAGPKLPEIADVSGEVTYQGKAVEGAEVTFLSSTPDSKPARGMTGADGRFSLKTYIDPEHDLNGAIPGSYEITVTKKDLPKMTAEDMAKMGGVAMAPPKDLVPPRYSDPKKSGLTATVKAKEKNIVKLELKDE